MSLSNVVRSGSACPPIRCESVFHSGPARSRACLVVLVVTASALVGVADGPSADDDRAISVGRWDVVAVEWNGNPVAPEWLARLQVVYDADGSWTVLLRRIPVAEGRSTNHQDVVPKTFELETLGSEGIQPVRYLGIYRVAGDIRELCIVRDGTPRPDDFSAPRHSNRMLVTLRRAADSRIRGGDRD